MGPMFTGVFFNDIKHIYAKEEEKKGGYRKQGENAVFDPYITGLHTTSYTTIGWMF